MNRATRLQVAAVCLLCLACGQTDEPHDHAQAHPSGHDHHEQGHGHGDGKSVSITRWSEHHELFAEHPPAAVGHTMSILLHVTELGGFRALSRGSLALEFDGPIPLRGETDVLLRPGIFAIDLTPEAAGNYRGRLRISGPEGSPTRTIEGIELRVYADEGEADRSVPDDADDDGVIEFLKEQQWGVPFATAFATSGSIAATVEVAGRIATPPGGTAEVGAQVAGRVVAPAAGFPHPGSAVKKGQVLASLVPAPSSPELASRAGLAVAEAEARASAARTAMERAERLIRDEAISQRELEDAEREVRVAAESVRAARRAASLYAGASGAGRQEAWRLTAPIAGTLGSVDATPGATVGPGTRLFTIVDTSRLWMVARVPEQDAARLRIDRNAHYKVAGLDTWSEIDVTSADAKASVVMVGKTVDPVSRTVEVIYSLHEPDASLRIGGMAELALPAGNDFTGVVVPRGAVLDQEGRNIVYVQVDGEHFEERLVRLGLRAGEVVGIDSGLLDGERVVTKGAHLVRLADRASSAQPHGHIH